MEADPSWSAVLKFANVSRLQFGKDIVFTYGPLGFLTIPYYTGGSPWLRIIIDVLLTFLIATGSCLAAWRLEVWRRVVTLAIFTLVVANAYFGTDLIIYLGLMCWGLLCLLESGRKLPIYLAALTLLASFSALVKLTYFATSCFTVGLVICDLLLRRKRRLSLGLAIVFPLLLLSGWAASGQELTNFITFLQRGLVLSNGFDQTMGIDSPRKVFWGAVVTAALTLGAILCRSVFAYDIREPRVIWRRLLLFSWLVGLFLVSWKHGFVRADREHIEFFLGFIPVLVLLLDSAPTDSGAAQTWGRALGISSCLLALVTLEWAHFPGYLKFCAKSPPRLAQKNLDTLTDLPGYRLTMDTQLAAEKARWQLRTMRELIGQGAVDVFGWAQLYAIFNDLKFTPRPVFQSYAAYTSTLMHLNEQFYLSERAPQYVLFRLAAKDNRFPPLEDARVLRMLLTNCELLEAEADLLLLKLRERGRPLLTLLHEGTTTIGKEISLSRFGDADLWMEIELHATAAGALRRFCYKPSMVSLSVSRALEPPTEFAAPAAMLRAGFLASPLLLNNNDVVDLYTGQVKRPSSYTVAIPRGSKPWWQEKVTYRVYRIDTTLGRSASADMARLRFPGFQLAPDEVYASSNAVVLIDGTAALQLPAGASLTFRLPAGAVAVSGSYGFTRFGVMQGAEFLVEEELADGTRQLLHSRMLSPRQTPTDAGLKSFSLALSERSGGKLILRSRCEPGANPYTELACWSSIRFKTSGKAGPITQEK